VIKQLFQLVLASGALLAAKSALLGIRTLVLLLIAAYGYESDLASASFALSLAEIGRWVADFGTDTWNVRAIARAGSAGSEAHLLTATLLIKAIGSGLVSLPILLICRLKLPDDGGSLGCIAVLLLMTSQVASLTISYFQAKDEIPKLLPMLIPCGGTILATLVWLTFTGRALAALAIMTVGEISIAVTLLWLLHRKVAFARMSAALPHVGQMARACVPTAVLGIVVGVYSRLDTLTLARFSLSALAVYTVAQRLFQPFQIAVTSFGAIVYSRAVLFNSAGRPFARRLLSREIPAILGCSLACSLMLFLGGKLLVENVFPQYRTALSSLTVLCISLPLLAFNSAITGLLAGSGRYWMVLSIAAVDLALTYTAMTVLIPLYGAAGTADGLLIGAVFNGAALSVGAVLVNRSQFRSTPVGISAHR
jgi:O-antigen/teichoic acid export membrane protein